MRKLLCLLLFCLMLPVLVQAESPTVALTFDDGPSGRFTQALLEGLEARNVQATFFLCGYRIRQYPELPEKILAGGHELGCHGYTHDSMDTMSRRDIAGEIQATLDLMPENAKVTLLRPPGGCWGEGLRQVAKVKKMPILQWSVDPQDWAIHDASVVKARVLKEVRDGDVILLHDMSDSSVKAALAIVDALTARGYRFTTVSGLAALRGTKLEPGTIYRRFEPKEQPPTEPS